jgi:hypothetical protein
MAMSQTTSDPNALDLAEAFIPESPPDISRLTDSDIELLIRAAPDVAPGQARGAAGPNSGQITAEDYAGTEAGQPVDQLAAFPPIAPVGFPHPILRRLVSGRYRATNGAFQLELRVDVDGAHNLGKISGDYYSVAGSTTSYFGSWVVQSPALNVTGTHVVVDGIATCSWNTAFTRARLSIPRNVIFQPPAAATLTWFNAAGTPGATYACGWESRALRTVAWEQDSVVGAVPFISYDTGSLPQPAGSTARTLSVITAYAEAGIEMFAAGTPNVVSDALAGPDAAWDESELHAAMQANFSLWADVPQWKVYTLVATSFAGGGVRGIMYDASDSHQRQGMAVFYDAIKGTDPATQRAQLRTYVHELGHCFNLLHSWQKNLANPPQPLGPNGGLGDLSWMNYPWKYQPPLPAPGGEAAYWAGFPFQFTSNELVHLRHGMRPDVIMGGNAFGTGASETDPMVFADRSVDHSGLALELRAAPTYALGEPVVIEIKLVSTGRGRLRTHGRLHPRDGLVQIAVQEPSGQVKAYRPLMPRCADATDPVVLGDAQPAIYDSAYIGYGQGGFTFEQVGTYRLRAVYVADDGSPVVSPTTTLRVRSPLTRADDEVAELLLSDGQGELLYLLGSDAPGLNRANQAMDELLDRHAKHPLAVFAQLVKGSNDERTFKTIDAAKVLTLRPARAAQAVRQLRSVVTSSAGSEGVDNITLNMVIRRLARAEAKAGDAEKAAATLDQMPAIFRKKGVKSQVLQVIEGQAQQEKTRLLADFTGDAGSDGPEARPDSVT